MSRVIVAMVAFAFVSALCGCDSNGRSVRVPNVAEQQVGDAFAALRLAGFRVSVQSGLAASRSGFVSLQSPAAGAKARAGTSVTLTLRAGLIGSIAVPTPMTTYRVPRFVGKRLSVAARWFDGKQVGWDAYLPPLHASSASSFFAAYTVIAQRPDPGTRLRLGYLRYGAFHLTPVRFILAPARVRR